MPFRHRNGILNLIFNFPDCSGMTGNISYAEFPKDVGPPDKSGEIRHLNSSGLQSRAGQNGHPS